jgi:hypothetical protein
MSNPLLPSQTHTHDVSDIPNFDNAVENQSNVAASTAHRLDVTTNPHDVTPTQVALGNVPNVKQNLSAGGPPTPANDDSQGYAIGSRWIDTTANVEWVCTKAIGPANWVELPGADPLVIAGNPFESIGYNGSALASNTAAFIAASPGYTFASGAQAVVAASSGSWTTGNVPTNLALASNGAINGTRRSAIASNISSGTLTGNALASTGPHVCTENGAILFSRSDDVAGHNLARYSTILCATGGRVVDVTHGSSFYCGIAGNYNNGAPGAADHRTEGFAHVASDCTTNYAASSGAFGHNNIAVLAKNGGTVNAGATSASFVVAATSGTFDDQRPIGVNPYGVATMFTSGTITMPNALAICACVMCTANNRTGSSNMFTIGWMLTQSYTAICDSAAKKGLRNVDELLVIDNDEWCDALATVKPKRFLYLFNDDDEIPHLGFSTAELDATNILSFAVTKTDLGLQTCFYDDNDAQWHDDVDSNIVVDAVDVIDIYDAEDGYQRGNYPTQKPLQYHRIDYMSLLQILHITLLKQYAMIEQLENEINAFLNL